MIDLILPGESAEDSQSGGNSSAITPFSLQDQTGLGTPEGIPEEASKAPGMTIPEVPTIHIEEGVPPPKRYAHHGKRRRVYTEELFRCQFTDMISRTALICNHLLWRNKPEQLREHLLEHLKVEEVQSLSDDQVRDTYKDAKRIFLEGIPEDIDDNEDLTEEELEENE